MNKWVSAGPLLSRRSVLGYAIGTTALLCNAALSSTMNSSKTKILVGFQPQQDEGTDFDIIVDNVNGSDDNSGANIHSAKATIQAGIDAASFGQSVGVRNLGDLSYNEAIVLPSNITLSGYGTEKPVVSGGQILQSAVACTEEDESIVGPNYAKIFKVVGFAKSNFVNGDPFAGHLTEAGKRMRISMGRLPNPMYPNSETANVDWLEAETTVVDKSGQIVGYKLPQFTDRYSKSQIENCQIYGHRKPNSDFRTDIQSFDPNTKTIKIRRTDTKKGLIYETNVYKNRFCLVNLLPAIKRGEWGFVDDGGPTVNLYFWPSNVASVNVEIEYSNIDTLLSARNASNVNLRSIIFQQSSSNDAVGSVAPLRFDAAIGSSHPSNVTIHNIMIRNCYHTQSGYGALFTRSVDDLEFSQSTIADATGMFGFFIAGRNYDKSGGRALRAKITRIKVENADRSPIRCYGQMDAEISRCQFLNSGVAAHANKGNMYEGGSNCLWVHNFWFACAGYWTWQESDRQHFIANWLHNSLSQHDARAIVDQNKSSFSSWATKNALNGDTYILNNEIVPTHNSLNRKAQSLSVGHLSEPAVRFAVINNVFYGEGATEAAMIIPGGWKTNIYTGGKPRDGTDVSVSYGRVYQDIELGDMTVKSNSPTRTAVSTSLSYLPGSDGPVTLKSISATYDWTKDINGDTFDLSNPPLGPAVNPENYPKFDPVWVRRPKISGIALTGQDLEVDNGVLLALGNYSTPSFQWCRTNDPYVDPSDWDEIPGATQNTYRCRTADEGLFIGVKAKAGVASTQDVMTVAVQSTFPLAAPSALMRDAKSIRTRGGAWVETPVFVPNNRALLISISLRSLSNSNDTLEMTIGNPGREPGEGTKVLFNSRAVRRASNQTHFAFIEDPGTRASSLQFRTKLGYHCVLTEAIEIDGMTGINVGDKTAGTNVTNLSPTITTTSRNSGVYYLINRFGGGFLSNKPTWKGAGELFVGNTGHDNATQDLTIATAFTFAASLENYSATCYWPMEKTSVGVAVEILS